MKNLRLFSFLCFLIPAVLGKGYGSVGSTSSYGYARTSRSRVNDGYYVAGRTGYYGNYGYHTRSGCTNSGSNHCGQDSTTQETERLYYFNSGTCSERDCKRVYTQSECTSAAAAVGDYTALQYDRVSYNTGSDCANTLQCSYNPLNNNVEYCATGSSYQCTSSANCLCWCVIGDNDKSLSAGAILGIVFGVLFLGCCVTYICIAASQQKTIDEFEEPQTTNKYNEGSGAYNTGSGATPKYQSVWEDKDNKGVPDIYETNLPAGWEAKMHNGKPYWINHNTQETTWCDPRTQ